MKFKYSFPIPFSYTNVIKSLALFPPTFVQNLYRNNNILSTYIIKIIYPIRALSKGRCSKYNIFLQHNRKKNQQELQEKNINDNRPKTKKRDDKKIFQPKQVCVTEKAT